MATIINVLILYLVTLFLSFAYGVYFALKHKERFIAFARKLLPEQSKQL